jgi:hypothetical protein
MTKQLNNKINKKQMLCLDTLTDFAAAVLQLFSWKIKEHGTIKILSVKLTHIP